MTGFVHTMPFGAALLRDGGVRFRLWAPSQDSISLILHDVRLTIPMRPAGDGWFELITSAAGAGSQYQFLLVDGTSVPDPASRQQAHDVHGASVVVDPGAYHWNTGNWRGRPWCEVVLYELHVGAFTPEGNFDAVRRKLDWLEKIGVTAVELMPVASFAGQRNWGYDGVLPFAPDNSYGTCTDLKALVDAAHERNLTIFLDVVYNHFGPEGNYLWRYASQFFTDFHQTPWGPAIDFSHPEVRAYFTHNALYWLNEYRFDGLRFDAVHAIFDDSPNHFLLDLAKAVHGQCAPGRHVHLVVENDANLARLLTRGRDGRPVYFDAQWNDDFHHVGHVLLTGEGDGYYADYTDRPMASLGKALAEGFIYQGEISRTRSTARGEFSQELPPIAFIDFLQNHDQVGNRAFGERLSELCSPCALEALAAILLLAPQIPLLFMGEEWGETQPFQFFCDYSGDLAAAVRDGRRHEFTRFSAFSGPGARDRIPDPNAPTSFLRSKLDWSKLDRAPHRERVTLYQNLLVLRQREIVPRLVMLKSRETTYRLQQDDTLQVTWPLAENGRLSLLAHLSGQPARGVPTAALGKALFTTHPEVADGGMENELPAWYVAWHIDDGHIDNGRSDP